MHGARGGKQSADSWLKAEFVDETEKAKLLVMSPKDLAELVEDAGARAAYHRTLGQEAVPHEVVGRILAGESPVRVWREHRGQSLRHLAARAGIGVGYLSQIESGDRKGTARTLKKIAEALEVDLDDLT